MNTRASAANLGQALKKLKLEWQRTETDWRDVKRREFEEVFITPLPGHIARAGAVIEELDMVLRKVRSDCE